MESGRAGLVGAVADQVPAVGAGRAVRVAVDGRDGSGKTTFADELAGALRARGRSVVRASVDGFHHPRAVRYRRGRRSPVGCWLDSYDLDALVRELLGPLGPGGAGRVRTTVHDVRTDATLDLEPVLVEPGAVLVLDGVFLHRDELARFWDFSVYLQVDMSVTFARMAVRDGTPADPDDPLNARYTGAQRLYAAHRPASRADLVVDNNDLANPHLLAPGPRMGTA